MKTVKAEKLSHKQKSGASKKKTKSTLSAAAQAAQKAATKNIADRKAKTAKKKDRIVLTVAKAARRQDKLRGTMLDEPDQPIPVYESTFNPGNVL